MNVPSQNFAGITFDQYIKTTLYMYIQKVGEVLSGTRIHMIISDANKTHVHVSTECFTDLGKLNLTMMV
jgi:hypothetical protein